MAAAPAAAADDGSYDDTNDPECVYLDPWGTPIPAFGVDLDGCFPPDE